jgi:hypothetical protein
MREHSLSVIVENQADREWLKAKVMEEHLPDRAIVQEGHTKAWHPALKKLVKAYEEVFESPSGRKHSQEEPHRTFDIAAWSLVDQGRVNARSAALARVSAVTWRPAMSLLNAILLGAKNRGVAVSINEDRSRFVLQMEDAQLLLAIREAVEGGRYSTVGRGKLLVSLTAVPGREVLHPYSIGDDVSEFSRLIFLPLYARVIEMRREAREKKDREAQSEAFFRESNARLERWKEDRKQREAEQGKVAALIAEAQAWEQAQLIRRYVASIPERPDVALREWKRWALSSAELIVKPR